MSDTSHGARARRTVARHGQLHSPGPVRQLMKLIGIAAAVMLVSVVGVAAYAAYDLTSSFTADAVDLDGQSSVPPDIGAIEGGVNMLVAGTDACEPEYEKLFKERCTGPDAGAELNDVNLLVHISDEPRRVTVVSFPRDLMVAVPECTDETGATTAARSYAQLNSTYPIGGLNCVVQTISQLSGQEIQYAAKVNWGGVIEITNAIGGVDVCVANGIRDYHTGLDLEAGEHTLKGLPALQFLRTRHGVGDGSDLGRISNQQVYMSSLARKLVSEEVLTNPATLLSLARTAVENVDPSKSLTNPMTLVQIAMAASDVPYEDIVFLQYPVTGDPNNENRVLPDEASAQVLWDALEANEPLELTGDVAGNGGSVIAEGEEGGEGGGEGADGEGADGADEGADGADEGGTDETTPPSPDSTPDASTPSPSSTPDAGVLPESIHGSNAGTVTCSNGNVPAGQ